MPRRHAGERQGKRGGSGQLSAPGAEQGVRPRAREKSPGRPLESKERSGHVPILNAGSIYVRRSKSPVNRRLGGCPPIIPRRPVSFGRAADICSPGAPHARRNVTPDYRPLCSRVSRITGVPVPGALGAPARSRSRRRTCVAPTGTPTVCRCTRLDGATARRPGPRGPSPDAAAGGRLPGQEEPAPSPHVRRAARGLRRLHVQRYPLQLQARSPSRRRPGRHRPRPGDRPTRRPYGDREAGAPCGSSREPPCPRSSTGSCGWS